MALQFGTSGLRGLVTEMTDQECYLYAKAFVQYLKKKSASTSVALAGDYRSSTQRIMEAVAFAIGEEGLKIDFCGNIPTPAVMNYGIQNDMASIMVTGSHIPDDRNGIKFNMPWGEVLKEDEGEISSLHTVLKDKENSVFSEDGAFKPGTVKKIGRVNNAGRNSYIQRFINFFPHESLKGLKIVFYEHSSVSRDILPEILEKLGGEVVPVSRSETFVPVDTEAVEDPGRLKKWVRMFKADALVSADGDGDRPLVVDEEGSVVRGDILGILVADFLGADSVSVPVSCNTALEKCRKFAKVFRTRIGSPYVIASMNEAVSAGYKTVVGYEANGGFLIATDIKNSEKNAILRVLPTRDAALPVLAVFLSSLRREKRISDLVKELPQRFTASGLLRGFPMKQGRALVKKFEEGKKDFANEVFSSSFGQVDFMNFTDGARITFLSDDIVHLRPSGNAPEFRCYTESSTERQAKRNNEIALEIVGKLKDKMDSF